MLIFSLLMAFQAHALTHESLLMKSIKLCFAEPIGSSNAQWLPSACHGGALISWPADRSYIQIVFDNKFGVPRAFRFASENGLTATTALSFASSGFKENCGAPLNIKAVNSSPLHFQVSKGGDAAGAVAVTMKDAETSVALEMKGALLRRVHNNPRADEDSNVAACYSSLLTTIGNLGSLDLLSKDQKKILDDAIFPTAGSELQSQPGVH